MSRGTPVEEFAGFCDKHPELLMDYPKKSLSGSAYIGTGAYPHQGSARIDAEAWVFRWRCPECGLVGVYQPRGDVTDVRSTLDNAWPENAEGCCREAIDCGRVELIWTRTHRDLLLWRQRRIDEALAREQGRKSVPSGGG